MNILSNSEEKHLNKYIITCYSMYRNNAISLKASSNKGRGLKNMQVFSRYREQKAFQAERNVTMVNVRQLLKQTSTRSKNLIMYQGKS